LTLRGAGDALHSTVTCYQLSVLCVPSTMVHAYKCP